MKPLCWIPLSVIASSLGRVHSADSCELKDPYLITTTCRANHSSQHQIASEFAIDYHNKSATYIIDELPTQIHNSKPLTALQQHVAFWDRNNDNIITPHEVYTGFRDLGFCIPFSLGGLLINLFFSYPTRLAYSYIPDPLFRIYIASIHKAKHGSDTGIYDSDGYLRPYLFDEMFAKIDGSGTGSLGVSELFALIGKNRVAADPAGWSFAYMEWWTTWLLLQKEGRVWKEDLRQCYDGSLFWRIRDEREKGRGWGLGYGWGDFFRGVAEGGTWRVWRLKQEH